MSALRAVEVDGYYPTFDLVARPLGTEERVVGRLVCEYGRWHVCFRSGHRWGALSSRHAGDFDKIPKFLLEDVWDMWLDLNDPMRPA